MTDLKELKLFERDRMIRNKDGKPIGRVILAGKYVHNERLAVALMEIPKELVNNFINNIYYINDDPYKIQDNLNPIKISRTKHKYIINGFYLEPV